MKDIPEPTGECQKLQHKFRGPLVVTAIYPGDTYAVTALRIDRKGRRYAFATHASRLKIW